MNIDTTIPQISLSLNSQGTENYNDLINKPSVNGVTLRGNMTSKDLKIDGGDVWELINVCDFSDEAQNSAEFLKDRDGEDFSLKKFRLIYDINASVTVNNGIVRVNDLPLNRNIATGVYINYFYNSKNNKTVFETLISIPEVGTVSINSCGGSSSLKQSQNLLFGQNTYEHYGPFYRVQTSWTEAYKGRIELWGVRES